MSRMRKFTVLAVLALVGMAFMPLSAQATAYTWTGNENNLWANTNNWSGGTYPNGSTDTATINIANNTPVNLSGSIGLGSTDTALTIGGDASGLNIGGSLNMRGNISNAKSIVVSGTLYNQHSGILHSVSGGGAISLQGGTISSAGGQWSFSSQNVSGYGTISAPVLFDSASTLTATGSGQTLTISGNFGSSSNGDVYVGTTTSGDTAQLTIQAHLYARNFTLNQDGILSVDVANGKTVTLSGNLYNYATNKDNWGHDHGFDLIITGSASTFEVAGHDYGADTTGFSNNFNLNTLTVNGTLQLLDAVDNGNRSGVHGAKEALYLGDLLGDGTGDILNLNGLWCYVMKEGNPYALPDGLYHGVLVQNSPVPIPPSALLLGSGLLGLLAFRGLGRRRKG